MCRISVDIGPGISLPSHGDTSSAMSTPKSGLRSQLVGLPSLQPIQQTLDASDHYNGFTTSRASFSRPLHIMCQRRQRIRYSCGHGFYYTDWQPYPSCLNTYHQTGVHSQIAVASTGGLCEGCDLEELGDCVVDERG